jgi:AbiTii
MASLIEQLQAEALDSRVAVADLLRKAKVVAEKLGVREFAEWVDRELNGYSQDDEFPTYRRLHGEFQAFNPYHGWQPIIFSEPEKVKWLFEPRELTNPAGQIETNRNVDYAFTMTPAGESPFNQ